MTCDVERLVWGAIRLGARGGWWRHDMTGSRRRAVERAEDLKRRGERVRVLDRNGRVIHE